MDAQGHAIASLRWRPWRIPFREEFRISNASLLVREGIVIELRDGNGLAGIGEASPLPQYAGGSLDAVTKALSNHAPAIVGDLPKAALVAPVGVAIDAASTAALRCGLETACMDLGSRQTSTPAANWLADAVGLPTPAATMHLSVNGTLDAGTAREAAAQACAFVAKGFTALKLKVGGSPSTDVDRVQAVRKAVGDDVELRIDANGGWDIESTASVLEAAATLGVSLCEQPLPPDLQDMLPLTAALRRETSVQIALDESCRTTAEVDAAIAAAAADAIVVKPMISGLIEGAKMLRRASEAGLAGIVTTSFDTSVGTAAAAQLAALLPTPRPPCGLATVDMLAGDIVAKPMLVERGMLHLGDKPGLGVTLDEATLETWATGPWSHA